MRRFAAAFVAAMLFSLHAAASALGPDGDPGLRLPGKVTWLDLATEDPASARAFYGAVFGWKFRDIEGAPASYAIAKNGSGKVAGIFRHARPIGASVGGRWLALISVPDVMRAAQLVRDRGGQVLLAPKTVAGRGTHAVFRDPEGAVFGVLAAEGGDPPDTPVEEGDVFWLDLFTTDPAKAGAFYAALAGYQVDRGEIAGRERTLLSTNGIARAGIAQAPASAGHAEWLPYILVADVPTTLTRVRENGGRVLLSPRPELLDGQLAVIADREGAIIGVVSWSNEGMLPGAAR